MPLRWQVFESNDVQRIYSGYGIVFAEHRNNIPPNHDEFRVRNYVALAAGQFQGKRPKPISHPLPNPFRIHIPAITYRICRRKQIAVEDFRKKLSRRPFKVWHGAPMTQPKDDSYPTRPTLLAKVKDLQDERSWQEFNDIYNRLIFGFALKAGLTEDEAAEKTQGQSPRESRR
jgi:hypothetical protein